MNKEQPQKNVPGNYFDKHNSKNPVVKLLMRKFYDTLIQNIEPTKPQSILEVGGGEGHVSNIIHERIGPEKHVFTEYEEVAIDKAKELYPFLDMQQADIYDLPFSESSFDLVVCCEVLEHLAHPLKALEEMRRVAKNHIIITVPNEPLWRIANMARGSYIKDYGNTPGHINHWSRRGLGKLIKQRLNIVSLKNCSLLWTLALCKAA